MLVALAPEYRIFVTNKPGNYRAYTFMHRDTLQRRYSGARDYPAALLHFRDVGLPAEWGDRPTPHGIHATFDGAHRWITQPVRGQCVLVGDAAAASGPVWGCGLSRTLRDVRLLRDRLLGDPDWTRAIAAYAADHDDFFHRLRRAEHLCAKLYFAPGERAEARRQEALALIGRHPELGIDLLGLGPETPYSSVIEDVVVGGTP